MMLKKSWTYLYKHSDSANHWHI